MNDRIECSQSIHLCSEFLCLVANREVSGHDTFRTARLVHSLSSASFITCMEHDLVTLCDQSFRRQLTKTVRRSGDKYFCHFTRQPSMFGLQMIVCFFLMVLIGFPLS